MAWAVPSNSATLNSHLILYNHCKELTAAQVNTYFTRGNHSSLNSYLHLWKDRHLSKKDGRESLSTSPWDRKRVGIVLLSILASVRKQEDSVTGHLGEMLDSTASPSAQQAYLRNDNTGEKKEVGKKSHIVGTTTMEKGRMLHQCYYRTGFPVHGLPVQGSLVLVPASSTEAYAVVSFTPTCCWRKREWKQTNKKPKKKAQPTPKNPNKPPTK